MTKGNSFVFYESYYEKVKIIQSTNKELAYELMKALVEYGLYGEYECSEANAPIIEALLTEATQQMDNNNERYQKKLENSRRKKIEEEKLDLIAAMSADGMTQKEIAGKLQINQSTISRRLAVIRNDYPELLVKKELPKTPYDDEVAEKMKSATTLDEKIKAFGF